MLAEGGLEPLWLFRVKRFSEPLHFRLGNLVASVFRPVLAKHTKHLSLVDILPDGAELRADEETSGGVERNAPPGRVSQTGQFFSPPSVQFKGEINDTLPRKRHQKRHLEFCTAYLLSRGSRVRVSPGAPLSSI